MVDAGTEAQASGSCGDHGTALRAVTLITDAEVDGVGRNAEEADGLFNDDDADILEGETHLVGAGAEEAKGDDDDDDELDLS